MSTRPAPPVVIGVGTEHRHDDRCGLDVVRALRPLAANRVRCEEADGDATRLLELWERAPRAWIVDAARSGAPVGTVRELRLGPGHPAPVGTTSSHGLTIADAIGLGLALGRLPPALTVLTIEAGDLSVGDGLSPAVARATESLVRRLAVELDLPGRPEARHA